MHFSRLRLSGFKSFVDAAELLIEPGMTGIVGPNGCGKSNLVEALRWAMGESSAKQLRGGEMDDVIFGGTDSRPPRNIAEVSLLLDNAERGAPARFNDSDEIEVVRRIERGSGSHYRVNGAEVRARDVQLLFADAVSGAKSTALVSQGRIGDLISAKPTQRRHLLEEAAGITGLHSRRHEAELRLRAAESNLERLDDVLGALDEQFRALKRQARQASRYRNLSDHIRSAEAVLFHWLWQKAAARKGADAEALQAAQDAVATLTGEVAALTSGEAEAAEKLPALRQAEAEAAAGLQRLRLAYETLEQEEQRLETARTQIKARLHQIDEDIARESALGADAAQAIRRLGEERDGLSQQSAREGEEIEAAEAAHRDAANDAERWETTLAQLTERIASEEARGTALTRRAEQLATRKAKLEAEQTEITANLEDARRTAGDSAALDTARNQTQEARTALDRATEGRDTAEAARRTAETEATSSRDRLRQEEAQLAKLNSEAAMLSELLAVGDPDLWPPLIDALEVEPGYEVALGIALGDDLSAPTDEAAPVHWRALAPIAGAPSLPAGITPLADLVRAPAALARRLTQIGVVEDTDQGNRAFGALAQGQRLVSRDGALWRWDGFVATGASPTPAAARLAKRNRLQELESERVAAAQVVAEAKAAFDQAEAAAAAARERESAARQAMQAHETAYIQARDRESTIARENADANSHIAALTEAHNRLKSDLAETIREIEAVAMEQAALPDIALTRQDADATRTALAEARRVLAERRAHFDQLSRDAATRKARLGAITGEIDSWTAREDGAARQLAQLRERRTSAEAEAKGLDSRPAEIANQRQTLFGQIEQAEARRGEAADALAEAETAQTGLARALKEKEVALGEAREQRVRREAALQQAEQAIETLAVRVEEKLGCAADATLAAVGIAPDANLPGEEDAERKLERLVRERDNMGPVNLRAEAESEELTEKIEGLTSEREDLLAAIAKLRQGIAGLNREGRERLLKAFEEVDTHFRDLFTRLFGGGKAHLALTDAEDPLEAGLEIMASPPGKRLQSMSLLSGGEQALTALSLLFAVFLTNPAPVCVLDEVDAPLDDANVERFCNLMDQIARESATRFLLITHHRLTMSRMDRLFGVTMGERGVSQLVSVDLQAAEGMRHSA